MMGFNKIPLVLLSLQSHRDKDVTLLDSSQTRSFRKPFSLQTWGIVVPWILLSTCAVWQACDRQPATYGETLELNPPVIASTATTTPTFQPVSTTSKTSLRIGTFNLHSAKGRDDVQNLDRSIRVIPSDLDLLFLQETRSGFFGLRDHQSEVIGNALGMQSLFLPTEHQYFHNHFGNALLSRVHHQSITVIPLSCTQGKKFRNALLTTIELDGKRINILGTHLDLAVDHDQQLQHILNLFESLQAPKILLGDLNTRQNNPLITGYLQDNPCQDAHAQYTLDSSGGHGVDWIIVEGLSVIQSHLIDTSASDHPLLWAELSLVPQTQPIAHNQ